MVEIPQATKIDGQVLRDAEYRRRAQQAAAQVTDYWLGKIIETITTRCTIAPVTQLGNIFALRSEPKYSSRAYSLAQAELDYEAGHNDGSDRHFYWQGQFTDEREAMERDYEAYVQHYRTTMAQMTVLQTYQTLGTVAAPDLRKAILDCKKTFDKTAAGGVPKMAEVELHSLGWCLQIMSPPDIIKPPDNETYWDRRIINLHRIPFITKSVNQLAVRIKVDNLTRNTSAIRGLLDDEPGAIEISIVGDKLRFRTATWTAHLSAKQWHTL